MTKDELDAIRARVTASLHEGGSVLTVWPDITALLAEVESLNERVETLENSMLVIERRLRVQAAPLAELVKAHGGLEDINAWKAVYSSAIRAQLDGPKKAKTEEGAQ